MRVCWSFPQVIDTENGSVTEEPPATESLGNSSLSSSTLELRKVNADDEGTYECVAIVGEVLEVTLKKIYLTVSEYSVQFGSFHM